MELKNIMPIDAENYLVARKQSQNTVIHFPNTSIGQEQLCFIGGPCSIENQESIMQIAAMVKRSGANFLRGGAFKPRTSPYAFQGLGEKGLEMLKTAALHYNLLCVTEVLDTKDVEMIAKYADILQIGARNMQNYPLLRACGQCAKPVLLKRAMSATLSEFLCSAEYILSSGNQEVILCERGIRTFTDYSANTLDISIIPAIKKLSHLPIIVDPSHATGQAALVKDCALAAIAAGADGLMIEVHYNPAQSISDAKQAISEAEFRAIIYTAQKIFQLRTDFPAS